MKLGSKTYMLLASFFIIISFTVLILAVSPGILLPDFLLFYLAIFLATACLIAAWLLYKITNKRPKG